jgi:hypothetical protein
MRWSAGRRMEITANEEKQEKRKGASNTRIWSAETVCSDRPVGDV